MEKKYVVERKRVLAGVLNVKSTNLKDFKLANKIIPEDCIGDPNIYKINVGKRCRSMMFTLNENNLAQDLRYTTPKHYPVADFEPKVDTESRFYIDCVVQLEPILDYLGFGEMMTQEDINKAYKILIKSKKWIMKHKEMFGNNITNPLVVTYSKKGKVNPLIEVCGKREKPHYEEPGAVYGLIKRIK